MGRREDRIEAELKAIEMIGKGWISATTLAMKLRGHSRQKIQWALIRLEQKGVLERTVLETKDGENKTRLTNHYRASTVPVGMIANLVKRMM